jgi:Nucleotidyl transferase AbiEii toxin, Type IV TA system
MNLHTNDQLFQDAVLAAAQLYNIAEIYIEKDYWITVVLHKIFHSAVADEVVFKGGTALSKCHKIIERFSEDVDMVVMHNKSESANQLKNRLKAITDAVAEVMPEVEIEGITNKKGMIRKTAHQYNKKNFSGAYGLVREQIIVEASWLGSSEPWITAELSCYVTEMMKATEQSNLIVQYNLQPFTVNVLSKERTLCEKIMSLVRFSQTQNPYADFFSGLGFDKLITRVGKDDIVSFKNNNSWLKNHPATAIVFSRPDDTWDRIKNTYRTTFKELVLGAIPAEASLINTLKQIHSRLEKVHWVLD